jgi:hypothetical protein
MTRTTFNAWASVIVLLPVVGACSSSSASSQTGSKSDATSVADGSSTSPESSDGGGTGTQTPDAAGGTDDCHHSCPVSFFVVVLPKDRTSDVAAVTPTGPCASGGPVVGSQGGEYDVTASGVGVCHLTVSFLSGAPDFVTDVNLTQNPGPCCLNQPVPVPYAVDVPESGSADAAADN